MKYFAKQKINPVAVVRIEKSLIERNYNFLHCKISGSVLYCYGNCQPTDESINYQYRIKYAPPSKPRVHVKSPIISYNDDIHMYPKDNSLCLYHKSDLVWDTTYHLFDTIIPWTHEWFVFYELYKLTGKWLHPFVSHKKGEKN